MRAALDCLESWSVHFDTHTVCLQDREQELAGADFPDLFLSLNYLCFLGKKSCLWERCS